MASFARESGNRLHINPEEDGYQKAYDAIVSAIYGYLAYLLSLFSSRKENVFVNLRCLVSSVLMYIYGLRKQKLLEAQNQ